MTESDNKNRNGKSRTYEELIFQYLMILIILSGVIFALINLFHGRSLWLDEAMLALNVISNSYSELLKPLEMNQIAPIGFLYIQKSLTLMLGNYDWVLRLFPFMCFLASIPLFYALNRRLFNSTKMALLACAFFSLNLSMIGYAIEAKQYSSDVFIAILILLITLGFAGSAEKKSIAVMTTMGVVSIWFSNIAILVLLTSGLYSIYKALQLSRKAFYLNLIPILSWAISFAAYYKLFIYQHPAAEMMVAFWSKENAFMPLNIFSNDFNSFIKVRFRDIFQSFTVFKEAWIYLLIFYTIGLFVMRKSGKALFLMTFTLILHLTLSAFKLYPFHLRLSLYLIPFIISVFSYGLWSVFLMVRRYLPRIPVYSLLLIYGVYIFSLVKALPEEKEEIKKSMSHVNKNMRPDECIYVYYSSVPAFKFYKDFYSNIAGHDSIFYGQSNRDEWYKYKADLAFKGTCWLIFSHTYWIKKENIDEEAYIINALTSRGYSLTDKRVYKGSTVYKMKI